MEIFAPLTASFPPFFHISSQPTDKNVYLTFSNFSALQWIKVIKRCRTESENHKKGSLSTAMHHVRNLRSHRLQFPARQCPPRVLGGFLVACFGHRLYKFDSDGHPSIHLILLQLIVNRTFLT